MNANDVGAVLQRALYTTLVLGGPIIVVSMIVGLAISIIQAATQINEATLTFVPKLVVTAILLMLFGGAMFGQLQDFTRFVFDVASQSGR